MQADVAMRAGIARRAGVRAEGGRGGAGGLSEAELQHTAASLPRRPDGGIDTAHFEGRARRLRRAALRVQIARLFAILR